ncbi:Cyclin-C, partial [Fragariocoptes setiger]
MTEEGYQKIMIFFANFIQEIGKSLKVKQQVIATSIVYFKRFYVRNSFKCIDPWLMAPTCMFLASKVEEFGVISNSRLISTCQTVVRNQYGYLWPSKDYPYRINHILECEFYLLEMMDCCLIVYHAYRPLVQYVQDEKWQHDKDIVLPVAWNVVNDSYRTDICLLYPPHQIAIACLHLACVITEKDNQKSWFAELNTDFDKILEITRHILNLYELWKNFDERKEVPTLFEAIPKPCTEPPSNANNQGSSQKPN